MLAEYCSPGRALQIVVVDDPDPQAMWAEDVGARATVSVGEDGRPIAIELLDPDKGLEDLGAVAEQYGLERAHLEAAARAALAVPDHEITIAVAAHSPA